jgi:hypothetical protein
MSTPQQLWSLYDLYLKKNDMGKAQEVLKQLQNFKSHPNKNTGCSHCKRKL